MKNMLGGAPANYIEFDRTVRGMLNRISTENSNLLLPLEPSLRGAQPPAAADCPPWWAARFSALMLSSYLQVIHTNRYARGLVVRSSDNVLPEYLDAVAPLLERSPRLVTALMAWFAKLFRVHDLCWPTARLLLLASREEDDRDSLPARSLGRLPPEIVRGRILGFLMPLPLPATEGILDNSPLSAQWGGEEEEKDAVAVLAHFIIFAPSSMWRRLSAFSFSLVELVLADLGGCSNGQVYLAASVLAAIAQRVEAKAHGPETEELRIHRTEDLGPLRRLSGRLEATLLAMGDGTILTEGAPLPEALRHPSRFGESRGLSAFVSCRAQVALEHARRAHDGLQPAGVAYA